MKCGVAVIRMNEVKLLTHNVITTYKAELVLLTKSFPYIN